MKLIIATMLLVCSMCAVAYADMQMVTVNGKTMTCITNGNITNCF